MAGFQLFLAAWCWLLIGLVMLWPNVWAKNKFPAVVRAYCYLFCLINYWSPLNLIIPPYLCRNQVFMIFKQSLWAYAWQYKDIELWALKGAWCLAQSFVHANDSICICLWRDCTEFCQPYIAFSLMPYLPGTNSVLGLWHKFVLWRHCFSHWKCKRICLLFSFDGPELCFLLVTFNAVSWACRLILSAAVWSPLQRRVFRNNSHFPPDLNPVC